MIDDATRHPGHGPWDETWFIEGTTASGHGLWLRYTLLDAPPTGGPRRAALWAAWRPAGGPLRTGYAEAPLDTISFGRSTLLSLPGGTLTTARADGAAGPIAWSLALHGGGWRADLVPAALGRLGKTYRPAAPDLSAAGTVTVDGEVFVVRLAGVLGHLWGARSRLRGWGWAHTSRFADAPGTVFEALGAAFGAGSRTLRPVGAAVLHHRGRTWRFTGLRRVLASRATLGPRQWTLDARTREASLHATFTLPPPDRTVLAVYHGPTGAPVWCRNAPGGHLHVVLARRGLPDLVLATDRAVGEVASDVAPADPPVLGHAGDTLTWSTAKPSSSL